MHNQRFFSYLSLFTFMMIVLVTANNFLLMFVGWEGIYTCLKWFNENNTKYNIYKRTLNTSQSDLSTCSSLHYFRSHNMNGSKFCLQIYPVHFFIFIRHFHVKTNNISRLRSDLRIGPHNLDVISILVGSILGDSHLEKRKRGIGTRIIFEQCNRNIEYIMWFHKFFAIRGYCTTDKPKLTTRIKKNNKVFYQYRVSSYTFTSLNWQHEMFYVYIDSRPVKIILLDLSPYLTPLALAIWFLDDGSKINKTIRIATNCFNISDLEFLCKLLKEKSDLYVRIHKVE